MSFISKTPGMMGGSACIRNTCIAVWTLVEARTAGAPNAHLLRDGPGLIPADLAPAWDYFARHRAEIMGVVPENRLA